MSSGDAATVFSELLSITVPDPDYSLDSYGLMPCALVLRTSEEAACLCPFYDCAPK